MTTSTAYAAYIADDHADLDRDADALTDEERADTEEEARAAFDAECDAARALAAIYAAYDTQPQLCAADLYDLVDAGWIAA